MVQSPRLSSWNIVQDPLIRQLMEADGVDPLMLVRLMAEVSTKLRRAAQEKQHAAIAVSSIDNDDRRRGRGNSFQIAGSRTLH